ncbi:DNA repair protein RadA [Acetomicrobium sp.]|uniref:DNA repair protein RadA n=1 Tax=Acetomicrobium sp. TaxID=1872099 RepID=UPI002FC9BDF7
MSKTSKIKRYRCADCGAISLTWSGRCTACGAWGTLFEEVEVHQGGPGSGFRAKKLSLKEVREVLRISSKNSELDRVLGGGWVDGSVVLLSGEPGVGKSTLLLQSAIAIASEGKKVLYVSGEESPSQVASRAKRLGAKDESLFLLCTDDIDEALDASGDVEFLFVDSIQTMRDKNENGWPGSPLQVRVTAQKCIELAKTRDVPVVMVGHITKSGQIAGPKLLEHMVDVVLFFEGDKTSRYRILRPEKNRFASSDEIGIFEMTEGGLVPVFDPSKMFWSETPIAEAGVAMGMVLEGSRPLVAEFQALACSTPFMYPKRTSRGIDVNKLHLLLAVLEKRAGLSARNFDVYVNVVGGLTTKDPGVDLALSMAIASSIIDRPIPPDVCFIGEVGLAGEVRPVARSSLRMREAERMGFKKIVMSRYERVGKSSSIRQTGVESLKEAVRMMFP